MISGFHVLLLKNLRNFEDAGLWVPYYKVASNLTVDVMTKYYNTFVDEAMKDLGVEATATTEATGLCGVCWRVRKLF